MRDDPHLDQLTQPPDILKDRYRLVEQIGKGGMAVVYRAHDTTLDRDVAIKFLAPQRLIGPEASDRFLREARTIARLAHPNIMTLHDVDREDTWHYLVLELIPGRDLHAVMVERGGPFPVNEALNIIRGVLRALAYAHDQGVIHRDIKPENVMITPGDQVKVTDFGMALTQEDVRLTQAGTIMGTALYLAPETLSGGEVDRRTDLYAAGVVLYELLAGRAPFTGDSLMAVASQILHAPVPALRDSNVRVPSALEQVVTRLLAKDPDQRFPSAEEVLAALPDTVDVVPPPDTPRKVPDLQLFAAQEDKAAALEAERRRLASLLQRDVIESLDLLLSQASIYEQSLAGTPQIRMALSVLTSLIRQTLQQTRDIEANLHPAILESMGLEPALQTLIEQAIRTHGLHVTQTIERLPERLPPQIELALFRAAQDAMERTVRHARAGRVTIQLTQHEGWLYFSMADDGIETTGGEMLRPARQRLEQLGAETGVEVGEESGLELTVHLPLTPPVELTPRELDVIQLLVDGLSNKEIASVLTISPRTVNFHLDNIYTKLGVNSRTEAAITALRQGWGRQPPIRFPV
jgi:serine/threonine protein kinase/DNA-binding CsgD family transcriptional regulator